MSKLLSQGGFGCIYYPGLKCNGKSEYNKNVVSKLQKTMKLLQMKLILARLL